jgi:hypothetical protein
MFRDTLHVIVASGFACGMAIFVAIIALLYPGASGVLPALGAYGAVAMLGTAVMVTVNRQAFRIRELERRLRDRDAQDAEPGVAADKAPE